MHAQQPLESRQEVEIAEVFHWIAKAVGVQDAVEVEEEVHGAIAHNIVGAQTGVTDYRIV